MRVRLRNLRETLSGSLWFVPSVMALACLAGAAATLAVDAALGVEDGTGSGLAWGGSVDGAREVLGVVAGSMITIAALSYSIIIVALTLASSQFGPRLLGNFLSDRINQVTIGAFVGTFIFCLAALRGVGDDDGEFVPVVSVGVAVLLAIASLGLLIFFIHHIAQVIQAPNLVAAIGRDLGRSVPAPFPSVADPRPADPPDAVLEAVKAQNATVAARGSGYLRGVDVDRLVALAARHDVVITLHHRPGKFVIEGSPIVSVSPGTALDDEIADDVEAYHVLGDRRSPAQDVEFQLDQIVELGVRALSPGVNDPSTAIQCIDWLAAAIVQACSHPDPSPYRYDDDGRLRLIAENISTFDGVLDAAFNQLRQYGRASAAVTTRLLEALAAIAIHIETEAQRDAIIRHAKMIERGSRRALHDEHDLEDIDRRYRGVAAALDERWSAIHADGGIEEAAEFLREMREPTT